MPLAITKCNPASKRRSKGSIQMFKRTIDQLQPHKPNLFLLPNSPRKTYYSRTDREKEEVIHWGQRKLLMVEIWFLTKYGGLSKNIVYVGAAPGNHIYCLAVLFPEHNFYLYDPNEFAVKPRPKIHIFKNLFTDKEAGEIQQTFKVAIVRKPRETCFSSLILGQRIIA